MPPVRVLQIVPAMNAGGMETFIMNVYRTIDRQKVQFDFLYHYDMPCFYDEEIRRLGGNIYKLTVRQDNRLFLYLRRLNEFFRAHPEYRVIHGHYSGFGMFYTPIARRHGVPVRAGHSHNTAYEHNLVGQLDRLMSWFFVYGLTDRFACGQEAGKALFHGRDFVFLPNGVDAASFAPDEELRLETRRQLGISDEEIVLGHIGRFNQQKNHPYLIEIFGEVLRRQPSARLLLLGDGPERPAIEKLVAPLGDRVIFAGVQSNTRAYYSAMDAFLLPSLFEGLPVVLAEAQSAGLPCFVSDRVDRGADLGCGMRFLPLGNPSAWADALLEKPLERCPDALEKVRAAGYDIRHTAAWLQDFYLNAYEENS